MKTFMMSHKIKVALIAAHLMVGVTACDKSGGGVSILSAEENFKVSISTQPRPVDILWVIDNSGSMQSSQTNLTNNFNSFIQDFVTLKYDFRMATTTTDTWFEQYNGNSLYSSRWRVGNRTGGTPTNSGVFVMNKNTPSLNSVFTTNANVGINGNGDERAFSSLKRSLDNTANADFRRSNAFLAVIIVSDEEDFSRTDSSFSENYNDPKLIPVSTYVSYLDTLTGSNATNRKDAYQVNSIYIKDATCLAALANSTQKIAIRYGEISDTTGGVKASLCDPFNTVLQSIKDKILVASAVFKLDREPQDGSIVVKVNGTSIASGATTWTFDSVTNSIRFAPQSVPAADDNIQITYDPKTLL
jgi:hypothetical protein